MFKVKTGELAEEAESYATGELSLNLGMVLHQLTPELARKMDLPAKSGLLVVRVENNSPAAEAGLMSGLDPAQSSSIILTTLTDVMGFIAFLGFAVLFQTYLV
jgi:hypothetical protein